LLRVQHFAAEVLRVAGGAVAVLYPEPILGAGGLRDQTWKDASTMH
jgi:hypothetical protein